VLSLERYDRRGRVCGDGVHLQRRDMLFGGRNVISGIAKHFGLMHFKLRTGGGAWWKDGKGVFCVWVLFMYV
jgi:hypothetical protein